MTDPLLHTHDLTVQYGTHVALHSANIALHAGDFVAVIGPNGAGKSTLLKSLVGLTTPTSGQVRFAPSLGPRPQDALAYVPQQQTLDWTFPVTAWDTVMMGRTGRVGWLRWPGHRDREIVRDALDRAGVLDLAGRHIGALSGGQRQRVLLARMLARQADLLLLDEPLTGVDAGTGERLMALMQAEARAGRAVLMVTHDLDAAAAWCDRLILVNRTVIAQGTPAQVYTPENVQATFTHSMLGHTHASA
ncbi:metal ABC transporter ATP-binding protein [Deinococcus maricopensis]|uniref:Phosphonate-transporting ATPase n=1 Tax=Deinococcus maricopensis (strain DSM 21211 / LMG 22137 / NRRL B-23946 / LB-34) TaxID=709986 RepID=E8UAN6_DEIML|nr:metal ABC transporter ATP-binding protein [Deinococcus maricopensis]ADV68125.1 Phosphonate-transporting ATPase [Deinococcus maricopensis DSM 21211]